MIQIDGNAWVGSTRPCDYSLSLQECSVYADFYKDESGCLYLIRISYDGYGCCVLDPSLEIPKMSFADSVMAINYIESQDFSNLAASEIIQDYLYSIRELVWEDALEKHKII